MGGTNRQVKFTVSSDTQKAVRSIEDLRRRFGGLGATAKENTREASKLDRVFTDMRKTTAAAVNEWEKLNKELRQAASQSSKVQAPGRRQGFGKDEIGDLSTFSGAVASVTGSLDEGSSVALRFAGDLTGAIEYIPAFSAAITGMLAALNPVTAVLVGVGAGVAVFVGNMISASEQLNRQIAANIQANADIERQIAGGLNSQQARTRIEELTRAREAELQIVQREKDARDAANRAAQEGFGILGGVATAFVNATSAAEEKSAQIQAEAQQNADAFAAEIARLNTALKNGELAVNDASLGVEKFFSTTNESIDAFFANLQQRLVELQAVNETTATNTAAAIRSVQELINNGLDFEGLRAEMEKIEQQIAIEEEVRKRLAAAGLQNTVEFENSTARIEQLNIALTELQLNSTYAAVSVNEAAKAQQDAASNALNFLKGIGGTITSGLQTITVGINDFAESVAKYTTEQQALNERVAKINENAAKQIIAEQSRLVQAQINAAKQISQLQNEAREEELKAASQFETEMSRRRRDFRTEQKRLEEDFYRSRFEQILNGSIASVILSERDLKADKRRNRQDFRTENADAKDDFEAEQKERQAALDARIAQINTELEEQQKATDARIAEIQAAANTEINIERDKLNEKLGFIQTESAATSRAHQTAISGINSIANAAQSLFGVLSSAASRVGGTASSGTQRYPVQPFAAGGIIPQGSSPIVGIFERRQSEVVIPLESEVGRQLLGRANSGNSVNINVPISVQVSGTGNNVRGRDIAGEIRAELERTLPDAFAQFTSLFLDVTAQGG
jgi:hypothetical protein